MTEIKVGDKVECFGWGCSNDSDLKPSMFYGTYGIIKSIQREHVVVFIKNMLGEYFDFHVHQCVRRTKNCKFCNSNGFYEAYEIDIFNEAIKNKIPCEECNSTGKVPA